jgi:hypothetical protein
MDGSAGPRSGQTENRSAAAEQVAMRMTRPQKITLEEMREISIRERLVYCSDSPAAVPHFTTAIENPMVAVRPRDFRSESARQYVTKGSLLIHWGMYAKGRVSNGFGHRLDDVGGLFRR